MAGTVFQARTALCRINGLTTRPHPEPHPDAHPCTTQRPLGTALECAAAGCDGRIGEDRPISCTGLSSLLLLTRCESWVVWRCTAGMTEQRDSRCPVSGCGVWKGNLSKRGGSSRWWYSVDSSRHLLGGQLEEALAGLSCNDHICPNCYKRIRRLQPPARNLLDELTAAALKSSLAHTRFSLFIYRWCGD